MSRRNSLWFAGLSLVVVSAAAATHANAQTRSDRRVRRTGKQQAPARRTTTDTVTITRSDTVRVRDTVFVDRPLPAPPPVTIHDTVRVPIIPPVRTGYFAVPSPPTSMPAPPFTSGRVRLTSTFGETSL